MQPINDEVLPGNMCFGCGLDNPDGLQMKIFRDPMHGDRLLGSFVARQNHAGLGQILHGGVQFTALDCMAAWSTILFRTPERHMPLTANASMKFMRPVTVGSEIRTVAEIVGDSPNGGWVIATSIADEKGALSSAEFEYVSVPVEKFQAITGTAEMPDAWKFHFGDL